MLQTIRKSVLTRVAHRSRAELDLVASGEVRRKREDEVSHVRPVSDDCLPLTAALGMHLPLELVHDDDVKRD